MGDFEERYENGFVDVVVDHIFISLRSRPI